MFIRTKRSLSDWLASPEFARILDAAPGAVAVCDRDGAPLATSGALRRATGLADALEGLGALVPDLAHVAGHGGARPAQTSAGPIPIPGLDGAGGILSPIVESEGGIAGYWAQLSVSDNPARAPEGPVLHTDPLAYAEVDRSGLIRSANAPFHDLVGAPEASLTDRSLLTLLARPADAEALATRLRDGGDPSGDYAVVAGAGGDVWLGLQFLPLAAATRLGVVARDVTAARQKAVNDAAILSALSRSQAVIEFTPDGTILTANENFLKALGYARAADVVGRHHRLFVFPEDQRTQDYARFWRRLASGEFFTGKFRRVTRTGAEIWIEASYNPVFRADGSVAKIVKFAQDITTQMNVSRKVSASLGMVEAVAAAAEQMFSSISAISGTMQGSRDAVTKISHNIDQSATLAGDLTQSAESMERVLGLIRNIAETVNLLALNATIEAARAGPAGRSFAVVAAEVKTLAAQTNDAIGEIAREIKQMQAVSHDVRRNVEEITVSAARLSDSVGTVASALSEQTMATSEIARNIAVVAGGVSELHDLLSD